MPCTEFTSCPATIGGRVSAAQPTRSPRTAAALLLVALAGCAPEPAATTKLSLVVTAQDALAQPLEAVRAWVDGRDMGATDARGTLRCEHTVAAEATAKLLVACPPGYATDHPERRIRARPAPGGRNAVLRVAVSCTAQTPLAALVVRSAPDLPILVDGERVGQTDGHGIEHVLLRTPPGTTVQVAVDTSSQPRLRPLDPVRTFDIDAHGQLLLFDQPLHRRARRLRRRRPPPAAAPVKGPRRPTEIR